MVSRHTTEKVEAEGEVEQDRSGASALDLSLSLNRRDHIAQHVAGADARQLIYIADQHQVRAGRWPHQALGQHQVEHGGLVHNDQIGVERIGLIPSEAQQAALRADFEQAVDRPARAARWPRSGAWPRGRWDRQAPRPPRWHRPTGSPRPG